MVTTDGRGFPWRRLPLLLMGLVALVAALWGGLLLLGLPLPTLVPVAAAEHGTLMVLGFLGTVISLERAVALDRGWAFAGPALAGAGGLALLVGLPPVVGRFLLCAASVVLVVVYVVVHRIQPAVHLRVMAAGAVAWYVAALLWLSGWPVVRLVPWLAAFLVLTILGERLELARITMLTSAAVRRFVVGAALLGAGLVLGTVTAAGSVPAEPWGTLGTRLTGAGMAVLALWGARHDVARRTIAVGGITRFMAVCLLAGYAWLFAGGVIWVVAGDLAVSGAAYDAALHAVFLGFVMSMVFGHAPVIVPAVLRVRLPFHGWFYGHVALLHLALLARTVAGDLAGLETWWRIGGVATEVAVVLFLAVSVTVALRARAGAAGRPPRTTTGPPPATSTAGPPPAAGTEDRG